MDNTDNLLADLNKLDINGLIEIVEASLKTVEAKLSDYSGVGRSEMADLMELDDKSQIFSRLTRISNKAFRIEDKYECECISYIHSKYKDILNDDILCTFYELKTWADRIDILESVKDMKSSKGGK